MSTVGTRVFKSTLEDIKEINRIRGLRGLPLLSSAEILKSFVNFSLSEQKLLLIQERKEA